MKQNNTELVAEFTKIHAGFAVDPQRWGDEFNRVGRDLLDAIRDWERRLCSGTERGGYGKYSANLADKYWAEIRREFPLIDRVGVTVNE